MIVLDNPGARETPAGAPYTCGTRMTLTQAAAEAKLKLTDLYVTYLIKCRPRRAYDRAVAHAAGRRYLLTQIGQRQPRLLLLLGDVVVKAVTGDATASVRRLRGSVFSVHDIPAVAAYHPLAARRRPNLYPLLVADMARARDLLSGLG